jgi:hypothetical protein
MEILRTIALLAGDYYLKSTVLKAGIPSASKDNVIASTLSHMDVTETVLTHQKYAHTHYLLYSIMRMSVPL